MEIANSPAKLWEVLKTDYNIKEQDFENKLHAHQIGTSVLQSIKSWHLEGKSIHERLFPGRTLDLDKSFYLCISYSTPKVNGEREYQLHSFSLDFTTIVDWKYSSDKCLRGFDPIAPSEPLFDWYGLSGGQLKYYPRAIQSLHKSEVFTLLKPQGLSISEKAQAYWETEWEDAYKKLSTNPTSRAR